MASPANPLSIDRSISANNTYIEKLTKLIPIEVTGLYMFLVSIGRDTDFENFLGIILLLLIIILPTLYLPRVQHVESWTTRLIITMSFVIWAATINVDITQHFVEQLGAPPFITRYFAPQPAGMVLALWTFILPAIYQGTPVSEEQHA